MWCVFGAKNLPANEKLYRARLLLKAPGHSCWTLRFFFLFFFFFFSFLTTKFLECIWLGGNPADLKLSSSFFQGLFIISALLHTIPLLLDILPTVISVLACTLFSCFLLLLLAPVPASANFMPGQSLENHQGRWKQSDDSSPLHAPPPKNNRPQLVIINHHLVSSLSQLKWKKKNTRWKLFLDMALVSYFAFHSSRLFI